MAELWYNSCHQYVIGMSTLKTLYNQDTHVVNYQQAKVVSPRIKKFVQDRVEVQQLLKENLNKAQERM